MSNPKIGIIVGTTRPNRFADKPVEWLKSLADRRDDLDFEVVDLRDYPMPLFEEPVSPARAPSTNPVAQKWAAKIASLDGYVFITAEYNHSISGALKNALDYVYPEFVRKPATFVAYGGVGGARAVEQLRLICIELQMAALRAAVHISRDQFAAVMQGEKTLADFEALQQQATLALDDLAWWTNTLKAGQS
ncbi:NADPH-dependent FMN reductase [Rhizobium puerariae]|uniref:NADPH-dependent FMN reductase n=1 Tax=Rhizobium puerariae TaxID=1585791 RepID=A0ABV6ANA4_9HYPH